MCYGNIVVYLRARHQIVMSRQQKKTTKALNFYRINWLLNQIGQYERLRDKVSNIFSIWKVWENRNENYLQTTEIYFWLQFAFWIFGTYETISDLEKKIVDFTFHSIKVFCFSVSLLIKLSATHIVHGQFYSNLKSQIRHIS